MNKSASWNAPPEVAKLCATEFESIALLLQGGGALGAYQAGVFQALTEHRIEPTWIAGISIGAINCAIIAGNPPADRVAKLRTFWELVSARNTQWGHWANLFRTATARGINWFNPRRQS